MAGCDTDQAQCKALSRYRLRDLYSIYAPVSPAGYQGSLPTNFGGGFSAYHTEFQAGGVTPVTG